METPSPIQVTSKDIKDWVHSQPDDRPVNMRESCYNDPCGCMMVQYGKEKFPDVKFEGVGTFTWSSFHRFNRVVHHAIMETSINVMLSPNWYKPTTFGELKALLS